MGPGESTQSIEHSGAVAPYEGIGRLAGGEVDVAVGIDFNGFEFSGKVGFDNGRIAKERLNGAVTATESAILNGIDGAEVTTHGFIGGHGAQAVDFPIGGFDADFPDRPLSGLKRAIGRVSGRGRFQAVEVSPQGLKEACLSAARVTAGGEKARADAMEWGFAPHRQVAGDGDEFADFLEGAP